MKNPLQIIALSGTPAALPSLQYLVRGHHLAALLCPAETICSETGPLEKWAHSKELPCWQVTQHDLEANLSELIRETAPDLLLVYGFPYKLPHDLLSQVPHGAWNVHFSLHAFNKGSITIHQLAESLPGSKVIHQCCISLSSNDESGSPINQLSLLSVSLLQASVLDLQLERKLGKIPSLQPAAILPPAGCAHPRS